jgi:hypothetical protein
MPRIAHRAEVVAKLVLKLPSGYVTEVWGRRFSAVRLSDPCQISSVCLTAFLIRRIRSSWVRIGKLAECPFLTEIVDVRGACSMPNATLL